MADLAQRLNRLIGRVAAVSDADMLGRFVAGRDGEVFAELVRRHGPMVLSVCRRVLRHRQDADDAFQATFLVLVRRAGVIKPRSTLGNWLYGVAYRTALGARRVTAARKAREAKVGVMRDAETTPDDTLPPDLREALDREVMALPDVYRAAIVACDLEGLSRREAADRLGLAEGTLSGRLARARSLLARRLSRFRLAVPAAGLAVVAGPTALAGRLADSTVRLGMLVAVGDAAVAAPVAALMEETMKTMLLTKLKFLATTCVVGCTVFAMAVAGWRADAIGAADPPADRSKAADASLKPQKAEKVRNADKDRIAELERERDNLLKQVAELRDRLAVVEANQKTALDAERAARLDAVRQRLAIDEAKQKAALDAERAAREDAKRQRLDLPPRAGGGAKNTPADSIVPPVNRDKTSPTAPEAKDSRPIPEPGPPISDDVKPRPNVPTIGNNPPLPTPAIADPFVPPGADATIPRPTGPDLGPARTPPIPAAAPASKSVVRVYSVGDLASDEKEGEALAKVLRATVDPKSWGVDAGVEYLPGRKVLVVRQSVQGHEDVADLLKLLQHLGLAPSTKPAPSSSPGSTSQGK